MIPSELSSNSTTPAPSAFPYRSGFHPFTHLHGPLWTESKVRCSGEQRELRPTGTFPYLCFQCPCQAPHGKGRMGEGLTHKVRPEKPQLLEKQGGTETHFPTCFPIQDLEIPSKTIGSVFCIYMDAKQEEVVLCTQSCEGVELLTAVLDGGSKFTKVQKSSR